jgi:hypothetical protein
VAVQRRNLLGHARRLRRGHHERRCFAQVDPSTPLLAQQFYIRQTLIEPAGRSEAVAAWGGGDHYLLRNVGDRLGDLAYPALPR